MLANATSDLSPSDDFSHDKFSIELIHKLSIMYNITNWRIFEDDEQIISVLHSADTFKGSIIDGEQHETLLQASTSKDNLECRNIMPKNIIRLKKLFDM